MQKLKKRYYKWKVWRNYSTGSSWWKFMVFLGLVKCPWFDIFQY